MSLQIPESDRRRLALLAGLKSRELDELYAALEAAKPALSSVEFTSRVGERSKLEKQVLSDIVRFLMNLYWVTADIQVSCQAAAEEVFRNATEEGIEEPPDGWEDFKSHIRKFLSLDATLGVASKALYVATQHPSHLHSSRVLTDARPVFGADPTKSPIAYVVSHTLQLDVSVDGSEKEFYVALDNDDLLQLKAAVERAIAKDKSLREALSATGVPVLGWDD